MLVYLRVRIEKLLILVEASDSESLNLEVTEDKRGWISQTHKGC